MQRIGQQLFRQRERQMQRPGDRKAIGLSEEQKGDHLMCGAHFGAPWDWMGGSRGRAGSHRVVWAMEKSWGFIQLWESERTAQPQYLDGTLFVRVIWPWGLWGSQAAPRLSYRGSLSSSPSPLPASPSAGRAGTLTTVPRSASSPRPAPVQSRCSHLLRNRQFSARLRAGQQRQSGR